MLFLTEMPTEAREKILYSGLQLFTVNGYKNTSVLDIVELAKVSKTTFYQHFKSKEKLMVQLVEEIATEIIEEVTIAVKNEDRIGYMAYAGIRRYVGICFTDTKVANLLLVESVGVSLEIEKVRHHAHRTLAELIVRTVDTILPTTVSEMQIRIISQAMIGAINEVVVQNFQEAEQEEDYDELARLLNRMVIGSFVNLAY
ncbi:TetR/AcrR family transcriptional regulator [Bacillus sp. FJAT-49736]|uniref:TetR/AcrR family transcriptional regulator n=1 Tax=Bacillus sp. FJAT-49736 TaxID=2833582 RepID=UPI001BC98FD9|nr:TetR/AcrR family transcriptional regulator [Bacillus sp. FJAT-49736]MBS4172900.1 TetR/AcrR family transcriptional regulator [Bacillus sp. FJAT-49736]